MTKNLHFCTKNLIRKIKYNKNNRYHYFRTYRTGFVPSFKTGEIINLNERKKEGKDILIKQGKVLAILPIQYKDIPFYGKKEIFESYKGKKFHPEHWFFEIIIKKYSIHHFKHFYDSQKTIQESIQDSEV